jgi:hypothetical protein
MKLVDYVKIMGIDLREGDETIDVKSARIVENTNDAGILEELDKETDIGGIALHLDEGCKFDFEKHINAIEKCDNDAIIKRKRYVGLDFSQMNIKEYDRRYKERPNNRIRYK